jgi:hypothetical protein
MERAFQTLAAAEAAGVCARMTDGSDRAKAIQIMKRRTICGLLRLNGPGAERKGTSVIALTASALE